MWCTVLRCRSVGHFLVDCTCVGCQVASGGGCLLLLVSWAAPPSYSWMSQHQASVLAVNHQLA